MPGEIWTASAQDWQQLIVRLLKIRYPLGEFVEVPDTVRGDCGIEGFTRDGVAFQCYSPEEPLMVAELTKRERGKLAEDLRKMVKYAATLTRPREFTITLSRLIARRGRISNGREA